MKDDKKVSHILQLYLQWPVFLTALVILAGAAVNLISRKAGFVMLAFTVIYAACAGTLYMYGKKRALGSLVSFASAYSWSQKQLLASLELPYAIADTDGKILWMNRAFEAVTKEEKSAGKSLTMLFKEITVESLEKMENAMEVHVIYGESKYRVSMKRVTIRPDELASGIPEKQTEQQILAVYLYDETELYNYKQAITDQKMVAGLIYLDNYDEALESVEEVRRSLLTALIDRKINKYISAVNGIVKKLEKDKYFFAIKQCYMPRLEKEKQLVFWGDRGFVEPDSIGCRVTADASGYEILLEFPEKAFGGESGLEIKINDAPGTSGNVRSFSLFGAPDVQKNRLMFTIVKNNAK